jgi:hypothetical protein
MNPVVALVGVVIVGILLLVYFQYGGNQFDQPISLSGSQKTTFNLIRTKIHKKIREILTQLCKSRETFILDIRNQSQPPNYNEEGGCNALKKMIKENISYSLMGVLSSSDSQDPIYVPQDQDMSIVGLDLDQDLDLDLDQDLDQDLDLQGALTNDNLQTIHLIVDLWLDKAFEQYCPGGDTYEVNFELYMEHAVRAVNDICKADGDFARLLYRTADYAVLKPLSMMS